MENEAFGLGRRSNLAGELVELGEPGLSAGRVLACHRGRWLVASADAPPRGTAATEPRLLVARGRLRESPPVTGDWVAIDREGAIAAVLERHGTLVRRAPGAATAAQVLAANVDLVLAVEALPEPNERRLERVVALALGDAVPVALLLAKADLVSDGQDVATQLRLRLGLADGVAVSARDGTGLAVLRTLLEPGATAVLLGPSGVGKSTLVNALLDEQRQATQPVRAGDGRGRHTTVTRELIPLAWGALILDTPGLRSIGLWQGAEETFADIDRLATGCRFADCGHDGEPDCAVRDAVDPERLASWRKLGREQAWLEDRKAAALEHKRSGRALSRRARAAQRAKERR